MIQVSFFLLSQTSTTSFILLPDKSINIPFELAIPWGKIKPDELSILYARVILPSQDMVKIEKLYKISAPLMLSLPSKKEYNIKELVDFSIFNITNIDIPIEYALTLSKEVIIFYENKVDYQQIDYQQGTLTIPSNATSNISYKLPLLKEGDYRIDLLVQAKDTSVGTISMQQVLSIYVHSVKPSLMVSCNKEYFGTVTPKATITITNKEIPIDKATLTFTIKRLQTENIIYYKEIPLENIINTINICIDDIGTITQVGNYYIESKLFSELGQILCSKDTYFIVWTAKGKIDLSLPKEVFYMCKYSEDKWGFIDGKTPFDSILRPCKCPDCAGVVINGTVALDVDTVENLQEGKIVFELLVNNKKAWGKDLYHAKETFSGTQTYQFSVRLWVRDNYKDKNWNEPFLVEGIIYAISSTETTKIPIAQATSQFKIEEIPLIKEIYIPEIVHKGTNTLRIRIENNTDENSYVLPILFQMKDTGWELSKDDVIIMGDEASNCLPDGENAGKYAAYYWNKTDKLLTLRHPVEWVEIDQKLVNPDITGPFMGFDYRINIAKEELNQNYKISFSSLSPLVFELFKDNKIKIFIGTQTLKASGFSKTKAIEILPHSEIVFEYPFNITNDMQWKLFLLGDTYRIIDKTTEFGEKVDVDIKVEDVYQDGWVVIPVSFENKGKLESKFSAEFLLEEIKKYKSPISNWYIPQIKIIKKSKGVKIIYPKQTRSLSNNSYNLPEKQIDIELPAKGSVTFQLLYKLQPGEYKLNYEYFRGKGSYTFSVRKYNLLSIEEFSVISRLNTITTTFTIKNKGANKFNGKFLLDLGLFNIQTITSDITLDINQSIHKTYTFTIPEEAFADIYYAKLIIYQDIDTAKIEIAKKIIDYKIEPNIFIKQIELNDIPCKILKLYVGGNYKLRLYLENIGNLPSGCKVVYNLFDETAEGLVYVDIGSTTEIVFPINIPEEFTYEKTNLKITLDYQRVDNKPVSYYIPIEVYGVYLDVTAKLNKDFYKLNDTATLTISVRNVSSYIGTLSLYAGLGFYEYNTKTLFSLIGTETKSFCFSNIPILGFSQKLFYYINYQSGKVIYINSMYIYKEQDFMVYADKDYFKPPCNATFTVIAPEIGTLAYSVSHKNYGTITQLCGYQKINKGNNNILILKLPEFLSLGSYDLRCILYAKDNKIYTTTTRFDVLGQAILSDEISFDKKYYLPYDTITATFKLKSTHNIGTATLCIWIHAPIKAENTVIGYTYAYIFLLENTFCNITLPIRLNSQYSGIHRLQYAVYKNNRLLGTRFTYFDVADLNKPYSYVTSRKKYFNTRIVELNINAEDSKGGLGIKDVVLFYKLKEDSTYTAYATFTTTHLKVSFVAKQDGIYQFLTQASDKAGNKENKNLPDLTLLIDTKAPRFETLSINFGKKYLIGTRSVFVDIKAEDELSGVGSLTIALESKELILHEINTSTFCGKILLPSDLQQPGTKTLYIKAEDLAGNQKIATYTLVYTNLCKQLIGKTYIWCYPDTFIPTKLPYLKVELIGKDLNNDVFTAYKGSLTHEFVLEDISPGNFKLLADSVGCGKKEVEIQAFAFKNLTDTDKGILDIGTITLLGADSNDDGKVNTWDFYKLYLSFFDYHKQADFDHDGRITTKGDFFILYMNALKEEYIPSLSRQTQVVAKQTQSQPVGSCSFYFVPEMIKASKEAKPIVSVYTDIVGNFFSAELTIKYDKELVNVEDVILNEELDNIWLAKDIKNDKGYVEIIMGINPNTKPINLDNKRLFDISFIVLDQQGSTTLEFTKESFVYQAFGEYPNLKVATVTEVIYEKAKCQLKLPHSLKIIPSLIKLKPKEIGTLSVTCYSKDNEALYFAIQKATATFGVDIIKINQVNTENFVILQAGTKTICGTVTIQVGDIKEDINFKILPGMPHYIDKLTGDKQWSLPTQPVELSLSVIVKDEYKNLVENAKVHWEVISFPESAKGYSLSRKTTYTDINGKTEVSFTCGDKPGTYTISASIIIAENTSTEVFFDIFAKRYSRLKGKAYIIYYLPDNTIQYIGSATINIKAQNKNYIYSLEKDLSIVDEFLFDLDVLPGSVSVEFDAFGASKSIKTYYIKEEASLDVGTLTLLAGDTNDDGEIDTNNDYLRLYNAFFATPTSSNWDAQADFDYSKEIDIRDFSIFYNNLFHSPKKRAYSFNVTKENNIIIKPECKRYIELGEEFELRLKVDNFNNYLGLQGRTRFEPQVFELISVDINNKKEASLIVATNTSGNIINYIVLRSCNKPDYKLTNFEIIVRLKAKSQGTTLINFELTKVVNEYCELRNIKIKEQKIIIKEMINDIQDSICYPNPLIYRKHGNIIKFTVPCSREIYLRVYDISGNLVKEKPTTEEEDGVLELEITDLSSGIYIYCIEDKTCSRKKLSKFVIIK